MLKSGRLQALSLSSGSHSYRAMLPLAPCVAFLLLRKWFAYPDLCGVSSGGPCTRLASALFLPFAATLAATLATIWFPRCCCCLLSNVIVISMIQNEMTSYSQSLLSWCWNWLRRKRRACFSALEKASCPASVLTLVSQFAVVVARWT